MALPAAFLIHSATLATKCQNYTLGYDTGSAVFTAGATLTGATSHATAIIVSTGAQAAGMLTLHTISGTFQNDEALSDNNTVPGAAVADGVIAEALDAYGELTYTDVTSTVACRFVSAKKAFRDGAIIATSPRALLASGTSIKEGDTLTSTNTGFAETFVVNAVYQVYEATSATVSHISVDIAAVV
jgi:hypothetical protein